MKRKFYISIACASLLNGAEINLGLIDVNASIEREIVKDVRREDIRSADTALALYKNLPSVSLQRRSGIANDILVRGQVKDNINVTIDGAKIYGACPNRMDPPISHVLANNIDYIQLNQGPFNIEDFGVLSADVKINTIKPEKEFHGDLSLNAGSWDYQKGSFSVSGGVSDFRFLLSGSTENGGQYKDGDSNDFVGQINRNIQEGKVPATAQYLPQYQDMDAFEKKTAMAKLFWDIADNQELRLSYTANRSDNVLYPSTKMDAIYDDSDIFTAEYIAKDLATYSKELNINLYDSKVEHPMSTMYRKASQVAGYEMTHKLDSEIKGAKIKNSFDLEAHTITVGLDYSLRNWDGGYYKNSTPFPEAKFHSIYDVDTQNKAIFVSDSFKMDKFVLDMGLRYDDTSITTASEADPDNDYGQLNGYITATYHNDKSSKYFVGIGKSSRVPDAKELYWKGTMGNPVGTPTLDETINYELDAGVEKQYENGNIKAKFFYSKLDNYIAYNSNNQKEMMMNGQSTMAEWNVYENVDAKLYGFELSGMYTLSESIYAEYGLTYQKGKKDRPLKGQSGTNMPNIPPLKVTAALNYSYDESLNFRAEMIAANSWDNYDYENGEQMIDSYAVLNLKASKLFGKNFELVVGVDNLFDTTYAISNTYNDLILLAVPGNEVMLLNEPGRYLYTNLTYRF